MSTSLLLCLNLLISFYATVIRNIAGDLVEKVELFDEFYNKKINKKSMAFRINYRHMDRSLTNEEVDEIQIKVRQELVDKLKVELR